MHPEASLPLLHQPVIRPNPEPNQSSPGHSTAFNIHFNTVLQYMPKPSIGVFLPCFTRKHLCSSILPRCATCSNHQVLLDLRTGIISGEAYKSCNTSTNEFLHLAVTSSFLRTNTFHPNTLSLCSSLNVTEQVSKPIQSKI